MAGVLGEIGWVQRILVNRQTGRVVDGHLRLKLALDRKEPTVPVLYVDLSEAEEALVLSTLDPIAALAEADRGMLATLLQDVQSGEAAVQQMLATLAEEQGIVPPQASGGVDDVEPQVDRAAELREEWGVEEGQLWTLGAHRVICGDCTDKAVLERLMGEARVSLVATDPPYGVSYAAKNEFLNAIARGNRIQTPIVNDHQPPEAMSALWRAAFTTLRPFLLPGASYYVTGPQGGDLLLLLLLALRESGFPLRHMLIWAKNNHVLGRCDYHYKHEPIAFGWVEGSHHWYGGSSAMSLWEIDKPLKSDLHPTMKPVELYARAITNSSAVGESVIDNFCGAGPCVLACEQLQRRCYGCEIDPGYVAVTLQRYLDATGQRPQLLEAASWPTAR